MFPKLRWGLSLEMSFKSNLQLGMQFCLASPYLKMLRGALWGKLKNNQQSVLLSQLSTGSAAFLCAGIFHACEKRYANAAWWVFKVI